MVGQSHSIAEESMRSPDMAHVQARVGKTPIERLDWAIRFARRDLDQLTAGDWSNLRLELTAFAGFLIREQDAKDPSRLREWQQSQAHRDGNDVYSERETRDLHAEFSRIIGDLLHRDRTMVGSYEMELWVERWPVVLWRSHRPVRLRTSFPHGTSRATHVLGHLLGIYGHLVKECPAPLARGGKEERCGRWFLARRPNQIYCSARCQSRATTRAARETRAKKLLRRATRRLGKSR